MLKFMIQRGDENMIKFIKQLIALSIIFIALFGGLYVYRKISDLDDDGYATITFDIEGYITEVEVLKGGSVVPPEVPNKTGYTFVGWDNKASFDLVTKDEKYKALYEVNQYTISFICDNEVIGTVEYDYNSELDELPEISKNGYEFVGWFYENNLFDMETMPAYDLELYATWYATINFEVDGIEFEPLKEIPGTKIKAPELNENDVREGYHLVWYKDSSYKDVYSFYKMPDNNITLYGRFEKTQELDKGFLDNLELGYLSNTVNSYEELVDYFEYMIFHRITGTHEIIINYDLTNVQTEVRYAIEEVHYDSKVEYSVQRKGNSIFVDLEFEEEATTKASLTDGYQQLENVETILSNSRGPAFENFEINNLPNGYLVKNSEQLYYVLERGYKPLFDYNDEGSSEVIKIYEEAKYVLRNIIKTEMNDYEKVHAIYDWLVINVTYDKRLKEYTEGRIEDIRKYRGFYLEGVLLDNRAVCDGIAKAFVVMCRIEGIEAIRVIGSAVDGSYRHAWNKVRINDMWYVVDATSGGTIAEGKEVLTHKYLLVNDDFYGSEYVAETYTDLIAYGEYDIYQEMFFEYDGHLYDFNITSLNELKIILKWYAQNYSNDITIDMRISFSYEGDITSILTEAITEAGIKSISTLDISSDAWLENKVLTIRYFEK
ncbi:MAG: InlB B-repeat-containing protein [Bacilli bacterium]|nr:InlB B-repeat-containing protein [Bacilli bacterium]